MSEAGIQSTPTTSSDASSAPSGAAAATPAAPTPATASTAGDAQTTGEDGSQFDVFVAVADPDGRSAAGDGPVTAARAEMRRVEEVLVGLRSALVEVVQRPVQSVDLQPLLTAMNQNLAATSAKQEQAAAALQAVAAGLQDFGQQVARNGSATAAALSALQGGGGPAGGTPSAAPAFVVAQPGRSPLPLLAIAFLLLCWAVVFWFKTGSPRLALGVMVVANLVGCGLLVARRS